MNIERHLRIPLKMEQLVQFTEDEISSYTIYLAKDDEYFDVNTIFYLDDDGKLDDNGNTLFPRFVSENGLIPYLNGDNFFDIIEHTKYKLAPDIPSVNDYIASFNRSNTHDDLFDSDCPLWG